MNQNFKDFIKTPRGKLTVALAAMLLSWAFLLVSFSDSISSFLPDSKRIANLETEVKELRRKNNEARGKQKEAEELRTRYREQIQGYWQEERDGLPDTVLRTKVQDAARAADLKLNTIGSVKVTRINTELYFAEIDLSTVGSIEHVTRFLGEIEKVRPALAWKRLELRPDNRPVVAGANGVAQAVNLTFNGTLRIIGYDGPAIAGGDK